MNCGSISNTSYWQGGVANITNLFTTLSPGEVRISTLLSGSPLPEDEARAWIDRSHDTGGRLLCESRPASTSVSIATGPLKQGIHIIRMRTRDQVRNKKILVSG